MSKFFMFALAILVATAPEFASAFTGVDSSMCTIANALSGTTARALGTLAIIFLGIGAFFGKVNWGLAVMVVVGIGAMFGATALVGSFTGGTAGTAAGC